MLEELGRELLPFNTADLLCRVGTLHLEQRNANRAFSLDALAHLIGAQEFLPGQPVISNTKFKTLLRQYLGGGSFLGLRDDPFPQMFTEEIPFHGGPYVVFTGPIAGEQDILRWLLKAADSLRHSDHSESFYHEAKATASLCLAVSDQIVHKSGLGRGLIPKGGRGHDIVAPDSMGFQKGGSAVTFSRRDLSQIWQAQEQSLEVLSFLCIVAGNVDWHSYSPALGLLHHSPFVLTGGKFIVPNPSLLVTALRQRVICIALENQVIDHLAEEYRNVIWAEIIQCLNYMSLVPIALPLPEPPPNWLKEGIFSLDSDKLLYVQLVTDDLSNFSATFDPEQADTIHQVFNVGIRARQVVSHLRQSEAPQEKVLILTLSQPVGRKIGVELVERPTESLWLQLTASDLRTIALDSPDRLELWKYAKSRHHNQANSIVMSIDSLDEYGFYRSSRHSFYASDDTRPDLLWTESGFGLEIRRRTIQEHDLHVVPSVPGDSLIEVRSKYGLEIPICCSQYSGGTHRALVVEGKLPVPVWVTGAEQEDEKLQKLLVHLVELVAHLLWRFEVQLASILAKLTEGLNSFAIKLELSNSSQWSEVLTESSLFPSHSHPLILSHERREGCMVLYLDPYLYVLLQGPDNNGERLFFSEIFRSFQQILSQEGLLEPLLPKIEAMHKAIEIVLPLGQKKNITILPPDMILDLGTKGLPRLRLIQESEFEEVLDFAGSHIRSMGWASRTIATTKERVEVVNDAVSFLMQELEAQIATLDASEWLPKLIGYQETHSWKNRLSVLAEPVQFAWSLDQVRYIRKVAEENRSRGQARLANLALMEHLAVHPRGGIRHFSLEVYDRLLALISKIISWRMYSDLIHYSLADISVEYLPSGRLGFDRQENLKILDSYMLAHMERIATEDIEDFQSHWQDREREKQELSWKLNSLDPVFSVEFGLTFSELRQCTEHILKLGGEQESPVKSLRSDELVSRLCVSLKWKKSKIIHALDFMSLVPAKTVSESGQATNDGFDTCRLNSSLSRFHRPLIQLERDHERQFLWGDRHLILAVAHHVELCLTGRIQAKSSALRRLIGKWKNQAAKQFENLVGQKISEITGTSPKVSVKKLGRLRIAENGQDLGDIDVLGVIPKARFILAIECKDFSFARTPSEIRNQLIEFVDGTHKKKSTVEKHLRRAQFLKSNLSTVLQQFNLDEKGKWKVKPILISNSALYTPYLKKLVFPFWSIGSLANMTEKNLIRWLK